MAYRRLYLSNLLPSINKLLKTNFNSKNLSFLHNFLDEIGFKTNQQSELELLRKILTNRIGYQHGHTIVTPDSIKDAFNKYCEDIKLNNQQQNNVVQHKNNINNKQKQINKTNHFDSEMQQHFNGVGKHQHTMDDANKELIDKYQFENKKTIKLTDSQYIRLFEQLNMKK